jgi:biotin transporter BioY
MMGVIVYLLTYVLGSFSSKSGSMSLRFVLVCLLYFFGSTIFLYIGVEWLSGLARMRTQEGLPFYLNIGASALALTAVLHIFSGLITAFLYVRGQMSQRQTLQRTLDNIRRWFRTRK